MAVNVGDIALVTMRGTFNLQRILLTLTYRCLSAPSAGQSPVSVAAALAGAWNTAGAGTKRTKFLACMPTNYLLETVRGQIIAPTRYRFFDATAMAEGTIEGGTSPNLSAAVLLRTAFTGRDQQATKHIGPLPLEFQAAGTLQPGGLIALTALESAMLELIDLSGTNNGTWQPCIYHRVPKPGKPPYTDLFSGTVQAQTRVQRRRTVGLGE